jgi:glycosyltransferase involved in cell wall biosynthesis
VKIVILTMYFYPHRGPRSFRATELAIELARRGNEVIVYALTGKFNYDEFQESNHLKVKSFGKCITGLDHSDGYCRNNIIDRVLTKTLKKIIEYPLIELTLKVPPIFKKEKNIDLLITIAFPHTIHWGAAIARKCHKSSFASTWISDCGDPYMGNSIEKNKFFYFKYVEKFWCQNTDYISVPIDEAIPAYYPEFRSKIKVIPQGFDLSKTILEKDFKNNLIPTFAYAGSVYNKYRDPSKFLEYISGLQNDFRFIVYTGSTDYFSCYTSSLRHKMIINSTIDRIQLINELSKVDFLINFKNESKVQSPSKLIDYALTKRPTITISSSFSRMEKLKFIEFLSGNYDQRDTTINIEKYDIKNITDNFLTLATLKEVNSLKF